MKTFAEQMVVFDRRRKRARILDEELASESGVSCATISRYRHGRQQPSVDRWAILQEALDQLISRRATELRKLA
jgi:transcriptional regulator with XRE-family HTH domain